MEGNLLQLSKASPCSSLCRRQPFLPFRPKVTFALLSEIHSPLITDALRRTIVLVPPLSSYQENYLPKTMETFIFGNYEPLPLEKEKSGHQCSTQPNSSMFQASNFTLHKAPSHSAHLVFKNWSTRTCAQPTYSGNVKRVTLRSSHRQI